MATHAGYGATHEIGIRIALGAQPTSILGMILSTGLRLITAGVAIGVLLSYAATHLLAREVSGISKQTLGHSPGSPSQSWQPASSLVSYLPAALRVSIPWLLCDTNERTGTLYEQRMESDVTLVCGVSPMCSAAFRNGFQVCEHAVSQR